MDVGKAENALDQPCFRVFDRAVENRVMIEVEINDVAVSIDRDAADVVTEIAPPGIQGVRPASRNALRWLPGIFAYIAVLVAVEIAMKQREHEVGIDAVALHLGRRGGVVADVDEFRQWPVPVVHHWISRHGAVRPGTRGGSSVERKSGARPNSNGTGHQRGDKMPAAPLCLVCHYSSMATVKSQHQRRSLELSRPFWCYSTIRSYA